MTASRVQTIFAAIACTALVGCTDEQRIAKSSTGESATPLTERFQLDGPGGRSGGFIDPIARQFEDGRVIIADQGRTTLDVFSPKRESEGSRDVRGSGPGETTSPFYVALSHDTVVMISASMGARQVSWTRISTNERGTFSPHRAQPGVANSTAFTVLDRFASGDWLVRKGSAFRAMQSLPSVGALIPDSVTLGVLSQADAPGDSSFTWLPRMQQSTMLWFTWPDGPMPSAASPHPLRPGVMHAVSGDALWTLDAMTGEGERWTDGVSRLRFSVELAPNAVQESDLHAARDRALANASSSLDSSRALALYDPATAPDIAPRASRLVPAHDGTVWVEVFAFDSASARSYVALDSLGASRGVFSAPPGVRLQYVGQTLVLGVARDVDGIDYVRAFAVPEMR